MACKCEKCGKHCDCGEKYCDQCLINESRNDDASKNIKAGGRFYGEKLEKEDT
jgi:hypothetical protein